ncbi:hypothetical protein KC851_00160 [Candidatus Kaiserbacteria bacterium]|nr:hypothetical protein [Candidatus Kaiserbacteria bacterium]
MSANFSKSSARLHVLEEKYNTLKREVASYNGPPAGLKVLKVKKLRAKDACSRERRRLSADYENGLDVESRANDHKSASPETEKCPRPSTVSSTGNLSTNWRIENDRGEGNFDVNKSAA